jgi:cell division protein FtsI/penicillin-binding protein 2
MLNDMNFILIIGIIIIAIGTIVIYRIIKVKRQGKKLSAQKFDRVKVIYDKLENGQILTATDVLPLAQNILSRELTYKLLKKHDRTDLFPEQYMTIEKAAESSLANWLEFPTELGASPDEMEHLKRVTIDLDGQNNFFHYEVFMYRTAEPHWAAKDGWILGVVGPFFDDSKPYDFPRSTFSRVSSKADKITPEEEAKWVHDNISMKLGEIYKR